MKSPVQFGFNFNRDVLQQNPVRINKSQASHRDTGKAAVGLNVRRRLNRKDVDCKANNS